MKKWNMLVLGLVMAIALAGCGGSSSASGKNGSQSAGVKEVIEEQIAVEENKQPQSGSEAVSTESSTETAAETSPAAETAETTATTATADTAAAETAAADAKNRQNGVNADAPEPETIDAEALAASAAEGIDVDLTALSATMVYSEVYNMMVSPQDYIGKTIKMEGSFAFYHDETTDNYYYACIVSDATACCSQGIEFILTDDYTYPDDYPERGDEICVSGVFDTYKEGTLTYCTLRNAVLL